MKKIFCILFLFLFVGSLSACGNSQGTTSDAVVDIGKSAKFSDTEIKEAIDSVKVKFKDFEGCNLTKIYYDETKSDYWVEAYMSGGKGSENGVKAGNVIVLLSDFTVDSSGGDGGFTPDTTYTDWTWTLNRDSADGKWTVDDWGYA